jgi:hypothetical protein
MNVGNKKMVSAHLTDGPRDQAKLKSISDINAIPGRVLRAVYRPDKETQHLMMSKMRDSDSFISQSNEPGQPSSQSVAIPLTLYDVDGDGMQFGIIRIQDVHKNALPDGNVLKDGFLSVDDITRLTPGDGSSPDSATLMLNGIGSSVKALNVVRQAVAISGSEFTPSSLMSAVKNGDDVRVDVRAVLRDTRNPPANDEVGKPDPSLRPSRGRA